MPLPTMLRSRAPGWMRDHPGLRAVMLASGLIPPRPMHSAAEAEMLRQLVRGARCVVEIGVYEGSSAFVLCAALSSPAQLHLIDPFVDESGAAMRRGWHGTPTATRLAVGRQAGRGGPNVTWHIARSQDVGRAWRGPEVDLVFVDGDHSRGGCREDWDVWHPHVRLGGALAFHDARLGAPGGSGGPGPTSVVDELFREGMPPRGWRLVDEIDTLVVVSRCAATAAEAARRGELAGGSGSRRD
jgi:predicted O-methyltransferase YrrM